IRDFHVTGVQTCALPISGGAQYTLCCDDATGGVVDDLIAYCYGDDHVVLVPNAANAAEVRRRLVAAAPAAISIVDEHEEYAILRSEERRVGKEGRTQRTA